MAVATSLAQFSLLSKPVTSLRRNALHAFSLTIPFSSSSSAHKTHSHKWRQPVVSALELGGVKVVRNGNTPKFPFGSLGQSSPAICFYLAKLVSCFYLFIYFLLEFKHNPICVFFVPFELFNLQIVMIRFFISFLFFAYHAIPASDKSLNFLLIVYFYGAFVFGIW